MTDINNNEGAPQLSPYAAAMQAQLKYQRALLQASGGSVNPAEIYCILKVLVLEVTALREMIFDINAVTPEGEMDLNMRMGIASMYCMKLTEILEANIAQLKGPKLIVPQH